MMYELKSSKPGPRHKTRIILGILFLIILGALAFLFRGKIHTLFNFFSRGVEGGEMSVSETTRLLFVPKKTLARQITSLREKLVEYESLKIAHQVLEDENKDLKEILAYYDEPLDIHVAGIIGGSSRTFYNRIIIDQGADEGVTNGDMVGLHKTVLLGVVREVTPQSALVELYASPTFSFQGMLRKSGIVVPVQGNGGGNFEIQVPRDVDVEDGDIITLAERPDMSIGVIKSVTFDPRDPTQTVRARTPVNVQELKYVEIYKAGTQGLLPDIDAPEIPFEPLIEIGETSGTLSVPIQ